MMTDKDQPSISSKLRNFTPLPDNKTPLTKDQLAAAFGDIDNAASIFLRASSEFKPEDNTGTEGISNAPRNS